MDIDDARHLLLQHIMAAEKMYFIYKKEVQTQRYNETCREIVQDNKQAVKNWMHRVCALEDVLEAINNELEKEDEEKLNVNEKSEIF